MANKRITDTLADSRLYSNSGSGLYPTRGLVSICVFSLKFRSRDEKLASVFD